jgi:hypothetical protein
VFLPLSEFKLVWDCLMMLIIIVYFFIIPLYISCDLRFSNLIGIQVHTVCVTFILLDVLVNINTGFFAHGVIVLKRKEIIKNYCKQSFIIDFLSISILTL